jgi:hypothetical protein
LWYAPSIELNNNILNIYIDVELIYNLVIIQLLKNNDRHGTAFFKVPSGYSFVITDVFVNPEVTSFAPGQFYMVVITADGGRSITVRSDGHTAHLALASGLVVPEPSTPSPGSKGLEARNTTFSAGPVEVQLLGYFVRVATGLGVGTQFV